MPITSVVMCSVRPLPTIVLPAAFTVGGMSVSVPITSGMKPELKALKLSGSGPTEDPPPNSAWHMPRNISMPASVTMKLGMR